MSAIRSPVMVILALSVSAVGFGCAGANPKQSAALSSGPEMPTAASSLAATGPVEVDREPTRAIESSDNAGKLESLWNTRMVEGAADSPENFTLGPGDLLWISAPLIDQLKDKTVRVSEGGTITLPLIGVINVANMTEEDLRGELTHRIAKYMYHPQIEVFLKHSEHREVGVLGDVARPGRYTLSSQSDTIMTMISRAGGLKPDAASRIILISASPRAANSVVPVADASQALGISSDSSPQVIRSSLSNTVASNSAASGVDPGLTVAKAIGSREVVIDASRPEGKRYLGMFARAGDVVIIPAAGQVTVQGWVDKPGAYNVTPGLTALGAIAAAGGANFTRSATILREADGGKLQIPINISKIEDGEASDVGVQSGDVVIVEKSAIGAVPYSLYFLLNKLSIFPAIPF
jgi:protein involved in polysaccharide export with SLBB domain